MVLLHLLCHKINLIVGYKIAFSIQMATDHLFVLGLFLLLCGQNTSSQTCPLFGTDGTGLGGSDFRRDDSLYFNFETPAQCNGTVTSWRYCYYFDEDEIEDDSSSQLYGAKFLVYRRSGSSTTYQPVANSTKLVSIEKRNVVEDSLICTTVTLATNEQFQIQINDIVAACVIDDSTYNELRVIRRGGSQDLYQYNVINYEDCTTQQLQTIDTSNSDFRVRSGRRLLLYANINSLSTSQCSAGSNPPPFSPSTTSGTYLNTVGAINQQCTDTITAWNYCYYPSSASDSQTTYTAILGVWRLNAMSRYELVTGSSYTLTLQPESTNAKIVCKSVQLQEGEYVRINPNDVIGVTIPSQNPIPMVASGASAEYSLQRSSVSTQPLTVSQQSLTTRTNMALHLYPDIEFVPTTPPPTTSEATTIASATSTQTTVASTTQTTVASTTQTTEPTTSSQMTPPQTTQNPTKTTMSQETTQSAETTTKATDRSTTQPTTKATNPPPTTQSPTTRKGTTTMTTSPPAMTLDITTSSSESDSTPPLPVTDQATTVELSMSTVQQPGGQETTLDSSNPNQQESRLSIGTLVGVVSGTIVVALVILFVSVVIVYKWQLCRCRPDKKFGEKGVHTGIQNVMYDAVNDKVILDDTLRNYTQLAATYEQVQPYDIPINSSPSSTERHKQIQFFTRSGDGYYSAAFTRSGEGYYAAVGPGVSLVEQAKDVKVKNESPYYSPANEEAELYEQIRTQGIKKIKKEDIEITGELGAGQFGKVEKGIMKPNNVEVAVKSLKSNASNLDRVKFLQEAAIMAQFKHQNVVTLHGVVKDGNTILIVLDLLNKGDLLQHLSTLKPDPGQLVPPSMPNTLLSFSQQVALGMVYLAGKGFVHRDLAARNILVSEQNICKIADFGMSRDLAQSDYYVSQGGKVPIKWTAPEAIYFKKYSTASDVWSYGCLLYEIWSFGYKPFKNLRNVEAMRLVDSGRRLPPPPGCPKVIYEIMMQCWNPEASGRPGFRDVLLALHENEDMVLEVPADVSSTHPQAANLGAPIDAGHYMYRDMQNIYVTELSVM